MSEFTEITVVGDDDTGLIASITTLLFERGVNIEDLDQGPIITQRAFNVPPDADVEDLRRTGQPLEAEVLLEAIDLHLDDAITVHRGRTRLRDPENADVQLGAPADLDDMIPDRPVDGLGEFVADSEAASGADD